MVFEKFVLLGFSTLGLSLSFFGLYENYKKRSEIRKAARQLKNQEYPSVTDILDNIDKVIADSVAVRNRTDGKKSALIVLGGRLITQEELASDHYPMVKLITKELRTYPLNIHGEWFENYDKITRKESTTPVYIKEFNLKNGSADRSVLLAEFNSDRFASLNANITGKDYMKKLSGFEDFLHRSFEMMRFAFKLFFIDLTSLEAGFTEQEFGIHYNVPAFMLCTLTVARDGVPIIGKIQSVFPSAEGLLQSLDKTIRTIDFNSTFFLAASCFFVFMSTMAIEGLRQDMHIARLHQLAANANQPNANLPNERQAADGLKDGDIIRVESYLCVACQVELREVVQYPCSHLRYCRGCFDRLSEAERRRCQQCEAAVASTALLYFN